MANDNKINYDSELTPEEKAEIQEALKKLSDEDIQNDEDFIKDVYGQADNDMSEVYKENKKNKESILDKISKMLLYYTIANNVLKLSNVEYKSLFSSISKTITDVFKSHSKLSQKVTEQTLNNSFKKISDKYNLKYNQEQREKLVNQKYFGKHFSERIWENEQEVAKQIQLEMKNFLKGKVNANQIAKNIKVKFDSNDYNAKRLTDTEVSRIQNELFRANCKKTGAKYVLYKATFCRTCKTCRSHHNITYKLGNAPLIPIHPQCRCFYSIIDNPKQSGGKFEKFSIKWFNDIEDKAINFYDKVRMNNSDIKAISKNTGWKEAAIKQIKNHVFYNKHKLENGTTDRLNPDYDMAVAWSRLIKGNFKARDILLLKHEYLESILEKKYNLTNKQAHDKTTKSHDWASIVEKETGGGEDDSIYDSE